MENKNSYSCCSLQKSRKRKTKPNKNVYIKPASKVRHSSLRFFVVVLIVDCVAHSASKDSGNRGTTTKWNKLCQTWISEHLASAVGIFSFAQFWIQTKCIILIVYGWIIQSWIMNFFFYKLWQYWYGAFGSIQLTESWAFAANSSQLMFIICSQMFE